MEYNIDVIVSYYQFYFELWLLNYDNEELDDECNYYMEQDVELAAKLGYEIIIKDYDKLLFTYKEIKQ